MTTTTHTMNWFITAATLRSGFELKHREDGSEFWSMTDEFRQTSDDFFVYDMHDDELPNDWRYQKIVEILDEIIEADSESDIEWSDEAHDIADRLTSIYTAELAAWLAENGNRASYHEDAVTDGLVSEKATLHERMAMAQYVCIKQMVDFALFRLGLS